MIKFDFSGRVAVVTGAGGGMGLEISNIILDAGGSVVMIDVKPEPESLRGDAERRMYACGDLTNEGFVTQTIDAAAARFGRIDFLANIAGVLWFERDASLLDMDLEIWDQVFDINLKSMVHTARATVPHMKKAGVGALSRSLAMQLAAENIRSNAIYPGLTLTPLQARWDTDEKIAEVGQFVPMGRMASPGELARVAVFLLSDGASYITGVDLPVDGGLLLK